MTGECGTSTVGDWWKHKILWGMVVLKYLYAHWLVAMEQEEVCELGVGGL